jgi:hypothetical protein
LSIGKATEISNFPVHIKVRVDKSGNVIPIEVNPMRFAGCTTDIRRGLWRSKSRYGVLKISLPWEAKYFGRRYLARIRAQCE